MIVYIGIQVDLTFKAEMKDDMGDDLVCVKLPLKLVDPQNIADDTLHFRPMS